MGKLIFKSFLKKKLLESVLNVIAMFDDFVGVRPYRPGESMHGWQMELNLSGSPTITLVTQSAAFA